MKIIEICKALEEFAPLHYQESYDNAGVQVGNPNDEATAVLLCIDITEEVVNEAINKKCNLIISHHPLIFHPIKSLTGKNMVERCVIKAIANNITIYSCHTNIDSVEGGVSFKMAEKIGLENMVRLAAFGSGRISALFRWYAGKYREHGRFSHAFVRVVLCVPVHCDCKIRPGCGRSAAGGSAIFHRCGNIRYRRTAGKRDLFLGKHHRHDQTVALLRIDRHRFRLYGAGRGTKICPSGNGIHRIKHGFGICGDLGLVAA